MNISQLKNLLSNSKVSSSMMENAHEILSRLKFIGTIDQDQKLHVRSMTMQSNDWYTSLSRSIFSPDSRHNSLRFVTNVIDRSFELITLHKRVDNIADIHLCKLIVIDLKNAQNGLDNLCVTYKNDTKFCCDIKVLKETITLRLASLQESCGKIFEEMSPKREDAKKKKLTK